ncbi:MAG: hypothetical protein AAFY66_12150, partial [Pseudomonadota bacterium]
MWMRAVIGGLAASLMLGLLAPALADEQDNRQPEGLELLREVQRSKELERRVRRENQRNDAQFRRDRREERRGDARERR